MNKLVSNDGLNTKLNDYILKSMMSNININNTESIPTSSLVYLMNNLLVAISDNIKYKPEGNLNDIFIRCDYVKIISNWVADPLFPENYSTGIIIPTTDRNFSHIILISVSTNNTFTGTINYSKKTIQWNELAIKNFIRSDIGSREKVIITFGQTIKSVLEGFLINQPGNFSRYVAIGNPADVPSEFTYSTGYITSRSDTISIRLVDYKTSNICTNSCIRLGDGSFKWSGWRLFTGTPI